MLALIFTGIVIHLTKTSDSFCLQFQDIVDHSRGGMVVARGGDQAHCICSQRADRKFCHSTPFLLFIHSGTTGCGTVLPTLKWGFAFQLNFFESTVDTYPGICCPWEFFLLYSDSIFLILNHIPTFQFSPWTLCNEHRSSRVPLLKGIYLIILFLLKTNQWLIHYH